MGRGARGAGLAVAAAVGAALGWGALGGLNTDEPTSIEAPVATPRPVGAPVGWAELPEPKTAPEPGDPPAATAAFLAEVEAVSAGCGIGLRTACEPAGCVALARMPDLEGLGGWVRLLGRSPRLVLGVAARDLGLPADAAGCGQAVGALAGEISSVALPSGDEVWCAAPDPALRAACGRAAAAWYGADAEAWSAGNLRILHY